jgi:hypothetical protein
MKVQLKANSFSYEVMKYEHYKKTTPVFDHPSRGELRNSRLRGNSPLEGSALAGGGNSPLEGCPLGRGGNDSTVIYSHRIDIELLNANPNSELKPEGQSEDYLNYYTTGTPEAGVTFVHQYHKVTYQNIYPNIDLEFVVDGSNTQPFKYNFIIKPGGRLADIQLRYNGANAIYLNPQGSINITTAYGSFEESIPRSYIVETGKDITVSYQQNREGVIGFSVGNYSANQTLVIDPWCTYFGWDYSQSPNFQIGIGNIATDNSRNIYSVGNIDVTNNIATSGAFQTVYGGGTCDVFIRKFNSSGIPLWCTYYGGSSEDRGASIVCDEFSNLYITGLTWSANNIATTGAFMSIFPQSVWCSFLAKFNSNGMRQWGTYFPVESEIVKTDHSGNVIIAGSDAEDTTIVTSGAHQTIPGGSGDDFVAKFTSSGTRLWGTFYGGGGYEFGGVGLAIDGQDNIFFSGTTSSTNNISTPSSFQPNYAGSGDNFIVKFNSSGIRQWGTYYGGVDNEDQLTCLAVDNSNNLYFSGLAISSGVFATSGAFMMTAGGMMDYCLAKFNNNGQRIWGTYFGGADDDYVLGLAVDDFGNVVFTGSTLSLNNIATTSPLQPNFHVGASGAKDAFIEKFSPSGNRLWGTYFGGNGDESGALLAIDNKSNIVFCGSAESSGLATVGAYQTTIISGSDFFIASLDSNGTFTTGIGDVNPKPSLIQVYPNPANDKIIITLQESTIAKGTITVVDVMGKVVKSLAVKSHEMSIEVKELPAGVYMVQYDDGEICEAVKVVKE